MTDKSAGSAIGSVTLLGRSSFKSLDASNVIFRDVVTVKRTQTGCVRYSYVHACYDPVAGSRVPRRFRCLPDLARAAAAERKASELTALEAAETGERVVLCDEAPIGSRLAPGPTLDRVRALAERLAETGVDVLDRHAALGVYAGPLVPLAADDELVQVHPERIVLERLPEGFRAPRRRPPDVGRLRGHAHELHALGRRRDGQPERHQPQQPGGRPGRSRHGPRSSMLRHPRSRTQRVNRSPSIRGPYGVMPYGAPASYTASHSASARHGDTLIS